MRYEVFHGNGGHCGPFPSLEEAASYGRRTNKSRFVVAAYDAQGVSGYRPVQMWSTSQDGWRVEEWSGNWPRAHVPTVFQWMQQS